jgi:quercetin dioxygenase-like cupin family protein
MSTVQLTRWTGAQPPTERELRDLMRRENLSPYSWSNGPGDEYPPHSHSYAKVIYVASGSITWLLPATGEEIETRRGDRIDLPPGVVHAAIVGREGVVCLEAHR